MKYTTEELIASLRKKNQQIHNYRKAIKEMNSCIAVKELLIYHLVKKEGHFRKCYEDSSKREQIATEMLRKKGLYERFCMILKTKM